MKTVALVLLSLAPAVFAQRAEVREDFRQNSRHSIDVPVVTAQPIEYKLFAVSTITQLSAIEIDQRRIEFAPQTEVLALVRHILKNQVSDNLSESFKVANKTSFTPAEMYTVKEICKKLLTPENLTAVKVGVPAVGLRQYLIQAEWYYANGPQPKFPVSNAFTRVTR